MIIKNYKQTAFCFDLDATITQEEILPIIAKEIGVFEEMKALTEAAMQGTISFESSFRLRCKILEEVPINKVKDIISNIKLNEKIVSFINKNKESSYIITGNLDVWIDELIKKIDCKYYSSTAMTKHNKLIGINKIIDKKDAIKDIKNRFSNIIVIGDGMNDVRMFEIADVSIAYGGVNNPPETLIQLADFVTYHEDGLCNILNTL